MWYALADALFNTGALDDAIPAYQQALKLNPLDTECWFDYGGTLLEHGDVLEALQAFNE